MAFSVRIRFTQGLSVGLPGQALFGVLGTPVTVSNADHTPAVVRYVFTVLYSPPGSAVVIGLGQDGSLPTFGFTPDITGGYELRLTGYDRNGVQVTDERAFGVVQASGRFIPPFRGTDKSLNFPGNDNPALGWARFMEAWLRYLDGLTPGAGGGAYTLTPPANGSWAQATWYIDPSNVSTFASDANDGLTNTTPLLTWREVVRRYGSLSPVLNGVTWNFMSDHPDFTDPVILRPICAGPCVMQGVLQQLVSTTITSLTAKDRPTAQPLAIQVGGGTPAIGQLVVNTDIAPNSRAFVQAISGPDLTMDQPISGTAPFGGFSGPPVPDDAWASGNSVTFYQLPKINLAELSATHASDNTVEPFAPLTVTLFERLVPGFSGLVATKLSGVSAYLCRWPMGGTAGCVVEFSNTGFAAAFAFVGCQITVLFNFDSALMAVYGGSYNEIVGAAFLQMDAAFGVAALDASSAAVSVGFGNVRVVSQLIIESGNYTFTPGQSLWGNGSLSLQGTARVNLNGTASATLLVPGVFMNNQSTASVYEDEASPAVWHSGRALTPSNLDQPIGAGGFTHPDGRIVATRPGGASIVNGET